jgi:superfamily II DNA or RNA helicase
LTRAASNVKFRLACSATPSPNDQTEYASHAVWLGMCATQKEFYSKFFVKDGTEWRMKSHAKDAFYDYLKSWACYIQSPSTLGFERGAELPSEPNYIIQESFTDQKYLAEGKFLSDSIDLKASRKIFGELRSDKSEGRFKLAIDSIRDRHAIIWCNRNVEEDVFTREINAVRVNGSTPVEKRVEIVDAFKRGQILHLVSKPSVLGFGVNIQEAEAHLYSGYTFSFEEFYQAVRRSHRYGRIGVLDVIVPVSEPERPVWDILRSKLATFKNDVAELQKRFFK